MNELFGDGFLYIPLILFALMAIGLVVFFIVILVLRDQKEQNFNDEMTRRLPEIEYTQIVSTARGSNLDHSPPMTKFLIVYKSGDKQIVNLRDGSKLFNECVQRLKNE